MRSAAGQASNLISGAVLTVTFTAFMFAERAWFPVKLDRILGDPARGARILRIVRSITRRVNRYLLVKSAISLATALLIWMIFRAAGLELAGAVAMLTFILNFIPTIGSIIATVIAVVLTLAQTGDPTLTLLIGGLCTLVQFVIGNVLDPVLLGQTLRLSSFGIILSLAFWGAIWGIAGAFLAVPIMVAGMIVCAHIPWLRPIAVLLSHEGLPDEDDTHPPESLRDAA
jgi:predicted PurR-regulated permease PerM